LPGGEAGDQRGRDGGLGPGPEDLAEAVATEEDKLVLVGPEGAVRAGDGVGGDEVGPLAVELGQGVGLDVLGLGGEAHEELVGPAAAGERGEDVLGRLELHG